MVMGGGMFPAGQGSAGNPGGGLPFAGIPSELQAGVDKLLADEPEHPDPTVRFSYQKAGEEAEKLSLRRLVLKHWQLAAAGSRAGGHHQPVQPSRARPYQHRDQPRVRGHTRAWASSSWCRPSIWWRWPLRLPPSASWLR